MAKQKIIKLKFHTEKRKVSDLIPYPDNPRKITEKQKNDLTESLKQFDLMSIPVINIGNTIISGHQRMKIMQLLGRGDEEIDVRVPNRKLTDEEFKDANLRENKNLAGWDNVKLASLGEERLLDVGFEKEEIDVILNRFDPGEIEEIEEWSTRGDARRGIGRSVVMSFGAFISSIKKGKIQELEFIAKTVKLVELEKPHRQEISLEIALFIDKRLDGWLNSE